MTRPTIEQYVTFHPVQDLERAAAFYHLVEIQRFEDPAWPRPGDA